MTSELEGKLSQEELIDNFNSLVIQACLAMTEKGHWLDAGTIVLGDAKYSYKIQRLKNKPTKKKRGS